MISNIAASVWTLIWLIYFLYVLTHSDETEAANTLTIWAALAAAIWPLYSLAAKGLAYRKSTDKQVAKGFEAVKRTATTRSHRIEDGRDPHATLPIKWILRSPGPIIVNPSRNGIQDLPNLFEDLEVPRLVVLGAEGSGKTTAAERWMSKRVTTRNNENASRQMVPFLLDLESWSPTDETLISWAAEQINRLCPELRRRSKYGRDAAVEIISSNLLVLVLDGFDKLPSSRAISVLSSLRGYPFSFILMSQPEAYLASAASAPLTACEVEVLPVELQNAIAYLESRVPTHCAADVRDLSEYVIHYQNSDLAKVLQTPIFLALATSMISADRSVLGGLQTRKYDKSALKEYLLRGFLDSVYPLTPKPLGQQWDGRHSQRWLRQTAKWLSAHDRESFGWWEIPSRVPWPLRSAVTGGLGLSLGSLFFGASLGSLVAVVTSVVISSRGDPLKRPSKPAVWSIDSGFTRGTLTVGVFLAWETLQEGGTFSSAIAMAILVLVAWGIIALSFTGAKVARREFRSEFHDWLGRTYSHLPASLQSIGRKIFARLPRWLRTQTPASSPHGGIPRVMGGRWDRQRAGVSLTIGIWIGLLSAVNFTASSQQSDEGGDLGALLTPEAIMSGAAVGGISVLMIFAVSSLGVPISPAGSNRMKSLFLGNLLFSVISGALWMMSVVVPMTLFAAASSQWQLPESVHRGLDNLDNPPWDLMLGVFGFLALGGLIGLILSSSVQQLLSCLLLPILRRGPFRIQRFYDEACKRQVLRGTPWSLQFRHGTVQRQLSSGISKTIVRNPSSEWISDN